MLARLEIPGSEHALRVKRLQERLELAGHDAMCVFGPVRISYLTGFHFAATERPVVLVVPVAAEPLMLIPQLETDHLRQQCPHLDQVRTYPEYPGGGSGKHPMLHLKDLLHDAGLATARLAADHDGYENRWGYRGPALSEVIGRPAALRLELVDDLRIVKSETEIALISVEPGLYVPGYAGFRHSDTVLVTETGCERLSLYPRDLASLIIA